MKPINKQTQNDVPQSRKAVPTATMTAATAAALLMVGVAPAAHADVKIVSEVTVSGLNANGGPGSGRGGNGGQNRRHNADNADPSAQNNGGPGGFGRPGGGGPGGPGGGMGGQRRGGPGGGGPLVAGLQNGTTTITTVFKNGKVRRETSAAGGTVVIYDRTADKIYTLNPRARTYSVLSYNDTLSRGAQMPEQMQQFMSQSASFTLKSPGGTAATTTSAQVAQRSTQPYSIVGSLSMQPKANPDGGSGGGNARNNGAPGGGGGNGFRGNGFAPGGQGGQQGGPGGGGGGRGGFRGGPGGPGGGGRGNTTLSGDLWAARASDVFTASSGVKSDKFVTLALAEQVLPSGNPLFKPFMDQLSRTNQIPLKSRLVIQQMRPNQPPPPPQDSDNNGGNGYQNGGNFAPPPAEPPAQQDGFALMSDSASQPPQGEPDSQGPPLQDGRPGGGQRGGQRQPPPPPSPITVTMEVKSIDTNATVDDAAFEIPKSYKEVPAPTAFGFGPGGGPGGFGGGPGGPGGGPGGFGGGPGRPGEGDPNGGPPPFPGNNGEGGDPNGTPPPPGGPNGPEEPPTK